MRVMLAISARQKLMPYHIDLTSAFLREDYNGPQLLFMKPLPNFDGTPIHPGKIAIVVDTILGTPRASLMGYASISLSKDTHRSSGP